MSTHNVELEPNYRLVYDDETHDYIAIDNNNKILTKEEYENSTNSNSRDLRDLLFNKD